MAMASSRVPTKLTVALQEHLALSTKIYHDLPTIVVCHQTITQQSMKPAEKFISHDIPMEKHTADTMAS